MIRKAVGAALCVLIVWGGIWWYTHRGETAETPQGVILDSEPMIGADLFFIEDGHTFLSLSALQEIDQFPVRVDSEKRRLWIKPTSINQQYEDSLVTAQIQQDAGEINLPLKQYNGGWFVDLERFADWLGIQYHLGEGNKVLLMDNPQKPLVYGAVVGSGVKLHKKNTGVGETLKRLEEGESVRVFEPSGKMYLARTEDGWLGYVLKSQLTLYQRPTPKKPFATVRANHSVYHGLSVAWDYIEGYSQNPNLDKESRIGGLDVLCPTWFNLNAEGIVTNDGSITYVRAAHKKGYTVWGSFRNGFDPVATHKMLKDPVLRSRAIAAMGFYVSYYELDGINLDFENVPVGDKQLMVQFAGDLRKILARQGALLTINIAMPSGNAQWFGFLDRSALSLRADYLILMAYDEHYGASETAGSVAGIQWVDKGILETLKLVPPEKLILGVPLYTRVWTLGADNQVEDSKALSMKDQEEYLKGQNPQTSWDPLAGQIRSEMVDSNQVKVVWMEDETSMIARLKLIDIHGLSGVAAWRRGFEVPAYWDWVQKNLKGRMDEKHPNL